MNVPRPPPEVPGTSPNVPGASRNMPELSPDVPGLSRNVPGTSRNVPELSPDVPRVWSNIPELVRNFPLRKFYLFCVKAFNLISSKGIWSNRTNETQALNPLIFSLPVMFSDIALMP